MDACGWTYSLSCAMWISFRQSRFRPTSSRSHSDPCPVCKPPVVWCFAPWQLCCIEGCNCLPSLVTDLTWGAWPFIWFIGELRRHFVYWIIENNSNLATCICVGRAMIWIWGDDSPLHSLYNARVNDVPHLIHQKLPTYLKKNSNSFQIQTPSGFDCFFS